MRWLLPTLLTAVASVAVAALLLLPAATVERRQTSNPSGPTTADVAIYTPPPGSPSGCPVFPFALLEAAASAWTSEHPGRAHALNGLLGYFAAKVCHDPPFRELLRLWGQCSHGASDICGNASVGMSLFRNATGAIVFLVSFEIDWELSHNGTGVQAVWSGNVRTGEIDGPAVSYNSVQVMAATVGA